MKLWSVTVPIAGHAYIEIKAESEEAAIAEAIVSITRDNIEEWEALDRFNQGNICYCPQPWEAEAVDETPDAE